jgi:hypothetical protein
MMKKKHRLTDNHSPQMQESGEIKMAVDLLPSWTRSKVPPRIILPAQVERHWESYLRHFQQNTTGRKLLLASDKVHSPLFFSLHSFPHTTCTFWVCRERLK